MLQNGVVVSQQKKLSGAPPTQIGSVASRQLLMVVHVVPTGQQPNWPLIVVQVSASRQENPVTSSQQGPKTAHPPPQTTPKGQSCLFPNDILVSPWLIGGAACIGSNRKVVTTLLYWISTATEKSIRFMVDIFENLWKF